MDNDNNILKDSSLAPYLGRQGILQEEYDKIIESLKDQKACSADIFTEEDLEKPELREVAEMLFSSTDKVDDSFEEEWEHLRAALKTLLKFDAMLTIAAMQNLESRPEALVSIRFSRTESWQCKYYLPKEPKNTCMLFWLVGDLLKFANATSIYHEMTDLVHGCETFGLETLDHQTPTFKCPTGFIDVMSVDGASDSPTHFGVDVKGSDRLDYICKALRVRRAVIRINDQVLTRFFRQLYFVRPDRTEFSLGVRDFKKFRALPAKEGEAYRKINNKIYHSYTLETYRAFVSSLLGLAEACYKNDEPEIRKIVQAIAEQCGLPDPTTSDV